MKRCPECRRDYYDETLLYCLDDGNALLDGPASGFSEEEPATVLFHQSPTRSEAATRAPLSETNGVSMRQSSKPFTVRYKIPFIVAAIIILGLASGAAWYFIPRKPTRPGMNMQMSKLVSGLKGVPANVNISPDGKYVAYSLSDDSKAGLWLRQVSQDNSIPIVPAAEVAFKGITFSHDSELIYFVSTNENSDILGSLYVVPVLGGKEPKKIKENVFSRISLSPDGKEFVFYRMSFDTGEGTLMISKTDGTGDDRKIAVRVGDDWFSGVAWSPDGKYVAYGASTVKGGMSTSIELVSVMGDEPTGLGMQRFGNNIHSLRWLKDGSGLVATAPVTSKGKDTVWHISFPGGVSERITNDLNDYFGADITADGGTAVMGYGDWYSRVWLIGPDGIAKRITNGRDDGNEGVAFLNDGRIVYTVNTNEQLNLWLANPDGTASKALTAGDTSGSITQYPGSPDGRTIVFTSMRPDNVAHIWRINVDGTGLTQMTTTENYRAMFTRDGKSIVFDGGPTSTWHLWKIPASGGEMVSLTDLTPARYIAGFSADGKRLICSTTDTSGNASRNRSAIVDIDNGKFIEYVDTPPTAADPNFSADGTQFVYVDTRNGVGNVWSKPLSGGPPKQLTKFTEGFIDRFAMGPDGKTFVLTRREGTNEIVLARNFR